MYVLLLQQLSTNCKIRGDESEQMAVGELIEPAHWGIAYFAINKTEVLYLISRHTVVTKKCILVNKENYSERHTTREDYKINFASYKQLSSCCLLSKFVAC